MRCQIRSSEPKVPINLSHERKGNGGNTGRELSRSSSFYSSIIYVVDCVNSTFVSDDWDFNNRVLWVSLDNKHGKHRVIALLRLK